MKLRDRIADLEERVTFLEKKRRGSGIDPRRREEFEVLQRKLEAFLQMRQLGRTIDDPAQGTVPLPSPRGSCQNVPTPGEITAPASEAP